MGFLTRLFYQKRTPDELAGIANGRYDPRAGRSSERFDRRAVRHDVVLEHFQKPFGIIDLAMTLFAVQPAIASVVDKNQSFFIGRRDRQRKADVVFFQSLDFPEDGTHFPAVVQVVVHLFPGIDQLDIVAVLCGLENGLDFFRGGLIQEGAEKENRGADQYHKDIDAQRDFRTCSRFVWHNSERRGRLKASLKTNAPFSRFPFLEL